jgi:Tol biopolymer transport system component
MQRSFLQRGAQIAAALAALVAMALAGLPAQAAPFDGRRNQFADDGFRVVWARTDAESVRGGRSWYWGPGAWFDYAEFNRQSPNGLRTVQYFDKARMEINNPSDRSFQGGVTNGLLVVELASGQQKKGNDPTDVDFRQPADVPVAGNPKNDNPNGPTYASFAGVATINSNGYRDQNRIGQRVGMTIDKSGNVSGRQDLVDAHPETEIVQYNSITGHNIPRVLWDFLTMQGPYVEGGAVRNGTVVDWTFAMGLPVSDAYWTRARVGSAERDVLVQLFERRVLTYTPDNPAGYKVEMGNVGQHYFQWRYPHLGTPWAAPEPISPPLYATDEGDLNWQLSMYLPGTTGNSLRLTNGDKYTVAYSYRRSWEPSKTRLLVDSSRGNGQHRQIYELDIPAIYDTARWSEATIARRLTYSDGSPIPQNGPYPGYVPNPANEFNPSISPDGTKIAFVSDRDGVPQIYLMNADGNNPLRLTTSGCVDQVPGWSPDGRTLYWESQCSGQKFKIMAAELAYSDDSIYGAYATLANVRELTTQDQGDNRFPRVAPDGSKLVITSYRDGNAELYTMNRDGSAQTRLTNSPGEDEAASWSPNGQQLIFASSRDGNYEIYMINRDGSGQTRLTSTGLPDRWVLWAQ